MNEPPALPEIVCPRCGLRNPPHATKCWLCESREAKKPYATEASRQALASSSASSQRVEGIFAALLLGAAVLATLVGVGLGIQDPGMLVPYFIVIGPAFLATGVRALYSVSRDQKNRPAKPFMTLFLTFVWSTIFTICALVFLLVASVVALFLWCVQMMGR